MNDQHAKGVTAFISYSRENEAHMKWVHRLAEKLSRDDVDVKLDQWHALPGEQLPSFMESSIRQNDFVLIICTPDYKIKSDDRKGGVGYEGDIITAELLVNSNHRKFIPILREGKWEHAAPSWAIGKYYIDLRDEGEEIPASGRLPGAAIRTEKQTDIIPNVGRLKMH